VTKEILTGDPGAWRLWSTKSTHTFAHHCELVCAWQGRWSCWMSSDTWDTEL